MDVEKARELLREIEARTFAESLSYIQIRAMQALRALDGEGAEGWIARLDGSLESPYCWYVADRHGRTIAVCLTETEATRIARLQALERAAEGADAAISKFFGWGCFMPDGRAAPLAYEVRDALRDALNQEGQS